MSPSPTEFMHPLIPPFEPPAISLGFLTIHAFGALVAMGFWLGSRRAERYASRLTGDADAGARISRLVTWLIAGTFIGGHLGDVLFYRPSALAADPWLLFRVWDGLSSIGGFAACVPIAVLFFRREGRPFWGYGDALAIGLTLGWFFGRLGCFSAHDHPGGQTQFWLGVYGMCPGHNPTIACHDLGLYEALWSLGTWIVFEALARRRRFPGFFVGALALSYGPYRFLSDFFRTADVDVRYAGLTPAQYGSVVITLVGAWVLWSRSRVPTPSTST